MKPSVLSIVFFLLFSHCESSGQENLKVVLENGLRMEVMKENTLPAIRISGAGLPDNAIEVQFPEHVTVRKHGKSSVEQLYLFRPGNQGVRPKWKTSDRTLEYSMDFGDIQMLAQATLWEKGVNFEYEFTNTSEREYDMVYAVTDPRLTSILHDPRLERTYVHHASGFELLASETPERLTMPLDSWLPCRYLDAYTWPIPPTLVEIREDRITYYNKPKAVDFPFIATSSKDNQWVVASFTTQLDQVGNVWSNPELTCQHVDPQSALLPGQKAQLKVNILIMKGTVEDAYRIAGSRR